MQGDYVSFETAKLLKDKGYPQCTRESQYAGMKYNMDGELTTAPFANHYAAPTIYAAHKWLRDTHNLYVEIPMFSLPKGFGPEIVDMKSLETLAYIRNKGDEFPSYEQALDAGIQYCAESLI